MAMEFSTKRSSLWHSVIKSKFSTLSNGWDAGETVRASYKSPWKFISSLYEEFLPLVKFKVGDGRKIRFWEDVWWGKKSFNVPFPLLYRLSSRRNCTISALGASDLSESSHGVRWNFNFTRNLNEREATQFFRIFFGY